MKKSLLSFLLVCILSMTSLFSKSLVVYFSCTGTTENFATIAASYLDADLFKIVPEVEYTADDLKYYTNCRADIEQKDKTCRPAIASKVTNMSSYDTIILAYPIWHGQAPRIISTFLESYNFSGKLIVPFCTSASSNIGTSDTELHDLCSTKTRWKKGKRFGKDSSERELKAFLDKNLKQ